MSWPARLGAALFPDWPPVRLVAATYRECHPRLSHWASDHPPGMSSNRACHHTLGISLPTGHIIFLGISSATVHNGHLITHRTSHHPPSISSLWASHYPSDISSTTEHFITHRASHHPLCILSHRTCHLTEHVITPSMKSHRACHPTEHAIPYIVID